ncbi:MAG: hypothetical protein FH749_07785 [Firmicutes bacterium]|nr:hypothetical protein [Bacillota bacterium]
MSSKAVTFEFFQLVSPNGADIGNVFQRLSRSQSTVTYRRYKIRLENYTVDEDGYHIGTGALVNAIALPPKAKINNPGIQPLGLADDEGVASLTSFLFAPENNTLVIQRNNNGMRIGSFLHLVQTVTGQTLEANMYLARDTIAKLNRFNSITNILLKVVQPRSPEAYEHTSLKSASQMAGDYNAKSITVTLSMGRTRHTHDILNNIFAKIRSIPREEQTIERLVVSGRENDDDVLYPLDLLKDRLKVVIDVSLEDRELKMHSLEEAVKLAYLAKQEDMAYYHAG